MPFSCEKCNKIFQRKIDLERHNARKIQCDRKIMCSRCGKDFMQISDLNRHLNKKYKCQDNYIMKELDLKIEIEKTKQEEIKLKQIIAGKSATTINGDNNNIHIGDTYNIINSTSGINYTLDEVNNMIISGDTNASLSNFIKSHFNNDEFPMNRCIKLINNKVYINLNEKMVSFDIARKYFNNKVIQQIECIINDFMKYSDEKLEQDGIQQKEEFVSCEKIETLDKIEPYIKNNRNVGRVKKAIITAHS